MISALSTSFHLDLLSVVKHSKESKTYLAQDAHNSLFILKIYKSLPELDGSLPKELLSELFTSEGFSKLACCYLHASQILDEANTINKPLKLFNKALGERNYKTYLMMPYVPGQTLSSVDKLPSPAYAVKLTLELLSTLHKACDHNLFYFNLDLDKVHLTPSFELKLFGLDQFQHASYFSGTHAEYLKDLLGAVENIFTKSEEDKEASRAFLLKLVNALKAHKEGVYFEKFSDQKTPSFLKAIFMDFMTALKG